MNLNTALYELKNDTVNFLDSNIFNTAGDATSGVKIFHIALDSAFEPTPHASEGFMLGSDPQRIRSDRVGSDGMNSRAFFVQNIRMIKSNEAFDSARIEPYVLGADGPDVMVTGQLSGCAFVYQSIPAGLVVAHVQPGGTRGTGPVLAQNLLASGRFEGHGAVSGVFGRGAGYTNNAYVVGIRTQGTWHLYGQGLDYITTWTIASSVQIV